jgi:sterol desaturase/sphingolipid hydroxylase (fatty acid hydroxylase superfamily)
VNLEFFKQNPTPGRTTSIQRKFWFGIPASPMTGIAGGRAIEISDTLLILRRHSEIATMAGKLFVSAKDESPDMFKARWLNYFSRVHPITPVVIYLPMASWFMYDAIALQHNSLGEIAGLFLAGVFLWSFFEYALHRWVFHVHPKNDTLARIHWLTHGVHHDYPQDRWRLVMPPGASLPVAALVITGCYFTLGRGLMAPFLCGFVLSYLTYDMLHFASHHFKIGSGYLASIKKHHMRHHFQNPEAGFGFTSKIWDWVFGTDFERKE